MARIAKQMVYTPTTIMQLLDAWKNAAIRGSNIPHGETLLYFALPDKAESFTPNAPAAYGLVDCMRGSMRQHFAGTRANYNSFMSMFSRWKKDFADKEAWDKEIAANPKANVHTKMSTEYADMVMMLQRPVTGWVSYEAWLLILGKAGVLDPAVITAVPRHLQSIRENMQRMYREWMELEDKLEPDTVPPLRHEPEMAGIVGDAFVRRDVSMTQEMFDVVASTKEIGGVTIDGMVKDTGVFVGYAVRDDIRESLTGCWFVNCIFTNVVFRGTMDGVVFVGCDFLGDCRLAAGVSAENMTFKKCQTLDGPLHMPNLTLTGLRMFQCGGMKINIKRSGVSKSHIVDGWVDCGRKEQDKALWDGVERIAPRSVHESVWVNGGLNYDTKGVPADELTATLLSSAAACVLSGSVRTAMVKNPINGSIVRCGEAAEYLLSDGGLTTLELSLYQWDRATDKELKAAAGLEALRTVRRGEAAVETVPIERKDAPANPLEELILKG